MKVQTKSEWRAVTPGDTQFLDVEQAGRVYASDVVADYVVDCGWFTVAVTKGSHTILFPLKHEVKQDAFQLLECAAKMAEYKADALMDYLPHLTDEGKREIASLLVFADRIRMECDPCTFGVNAADLLSGIDPDLSAKLFGQEVSA